MQASLKKKKNLEVRVYTSAGTAESFLLSDPCQIDGVCNKMDPATVFAKKRVIVAGEKFKTVFLASHVLRVDFMREEIRLWDFPGGYADIVDLTEEEFRKHAHLDEPELMRKREDETVVGDLVVSFVELVMVGGRRFHLMAEYPMKLPVENQTLLRLVLSSSVLHLRLACGGVGVLNLANVISYAVYPGTSQNPADTWVGERVGRAK
jgi:hypothetical protein